MELDEVLSKRDQINTHLLAAVDHATQTWGTKVTRVDIKDVLPPEDITRAMARQLTADREKRAQILTAEGTRQSEILRAEGLKQAKILEAEGNLEAAKRQAEARERLAGAEAEATRLLVASVGNPEAALQYFVAQRYVDALQKLGESPAARMIVVPTEFSNICRYYDSHYRNDEEHGQKIMLHNGFMLPFSEWYYCSLNHFRLGSMPSGLASLPCLPQ
jgi:regulator of protease activity HflC (stomatin/prohibitin superfamily)